jgi:hypothetical protein
MRRSPLAPLALAAIAAALAPAAARAADPDAPSVPAMTPAEAAAAKPGVDADARDAAAAGLPLPEPASSQAAAVDQALHPPPPPPLPRLAVAVSGGSPEFVTASLVFRPFPSVRFFGGPSWSYFAWGLQGGVVVAPWNGSVTPTLSVAVGKIFPADLSRYAGSGAKRELEPLLRRVDYQYAAVDLGLELGNPRGFAFFLRLGLAFASASADGDATYVADRGATVTVKDAAVHATVPSLKLGFNYWL